MERIYALLFMALVITGLSAAQAGTLYKWVDSQGRVSYNEQPPPEGSGYRVEEKTLRTGERSGGESSPEVNVLVVLYSTPKCATCDLARLYLDKRKVPYTEKNVESDAKSQKELMEKSGSKLVPTILVGSKVMVGYMESLLAGELDAAGYSKNPNSESDNSEAAKKE